MINFLTKSRSPQLYHAMMIRILLISTILWISWDHIKPARNLVSDAMIQISNIIRD